MLCPHCNKEHPSELNFCPSTGQSLHIGKCVCPSCGSENSPTVKYCTRCGTFLDDNSESLTNSEFDQDRPTPGSHRFHYHLWIALAFSLLLLTGIIFIVNQFYNRSALSKLDQDKNNSQNDSNNSIVEGLTKLTSQSSSTVEITEVIILLPDATHTVKPTITPMPTASLTPSPTTTLTPTPTTEVITRINPKDQALLVNIPAGKFFMGSNPDSDPYFWGAEAPTHEVELDGFWIYRTEVTNEMYLACTKEQACPKPKQFYSSTRSEYYLSESYKDYPVIYVSYIDASAYCIWAGARLPTEAEWEKAARGEDGRLFPWGDEAPDETLANFVGSGLFDTAPVGSYPAGASKYGGYDMAGNVLEWTADWFQELYYSSSPKVNPRGPTTGERKVIRGGSWFNTTDGQRTVGRASMRPNETRDVIGFRCVVDDK